MKCRLRCTLVPQNAVPRTSGRLRWPWRTLWMVERSRKWFGGVHVRCGHGVIICACDDRQVLSLAPPGRGTVGHVCSRRRADLAVSEADRLRGHFDRRAFARLLPEFVERVAPVVGVVAFAQGVDGVARDGLVVERHLRDRSLRWNGEGDVVTLLPVGAGVPCSSAHDSRPDRAPAQLTLSLRLPWAKGRPGTLDFTDSARRASFQAGGCTPRPFRNPERNQLTSAACWP